MLFRLARRKFVSARFFVSFRSVVASLAEIGPFFSSGASEITEMIIAFNLNLIAIMAVVVVTGFVQGIKGA